MNIQIKKEVFTQFNPKLQVAFILAKNVDNKRKLAEAKHLLVEMSQLISLTFHKETIKNHNLISSWMIAQKKLGKKAKHYHTSVEKLIIKILRKKSVTSNDTLTNLLRYLALKHIVPFGADDFNETAGDVTFDVAAGKKRVGILKSLEPDALYYHDEKRTLGTKLDYWKSQKTKLTLKTTSALIHFDILPPISNKEMNTLVKEANTLIKTFCNAKTKVFVLNKKKKVINV